MLSVVLTNDHKRVTSQIEHLMHELHAEARRAPDAQAAKQPRASQDTTASPITSQAAPVSVSAAGPVMRPFAVVDEVSSNSPAEEAGVIVGDQLVVFGNITAQTQNTLPAVAAALQVSLTLLLMCS